MVSNDLSGLACARRQSLMDWLPRTGIVQEIPFINHTCPDMQNRFDTAGPQSIDMMDLLRGIWARKMLLFAIPAIFGLGAIAFVMTTPPTYTSEAQILIDNLDTPYDRSQVTDPQGRVVIDDRDVLSQVSVISSRDLADRVIRQLGLAGTPEFDPLTRGTGIAGRLAILLGFREDPATKTPEQRAYDRYADKLNVYQIPQSKIIVIKYTASDRKTAADVANALAEVYVMSTREAQSEPMGRARDWLALQIEALRRKVVESETAAEEFRANAGLLKGTQATLGTQELSELSSQITLAEAARSEAQAKAQNIRALLTSKGNIEASPDVMSSSLIQHLREQQIALNRSLTELSVTYLPGHPKIVAIRNELSGIERQMRSEALRIVAGLEDEARIANSREASLRASLNAAKAKASTSNQDEVKLRAMEREATANRELLETFLNRYTDASSRQDLGAQPGMARIIQRAAIPANPTFPIPGPTVLLAIVAGLALGLGLAFLAAVMAAASGQRREREPVLVSAAPPVRPDPEFRAEPEQTRAVEREIEVHQDPPPAEPPPGPPEERILQAVAPLEQRVQAIIQASQPVFQEPVAEMEQAAPQMQAKVPPPAPPQQKMFPALCDVPATEDMATAVANSYQPLGNPDGDYAYAMQRAAVWMQSARQTLGVQRLAVAGLGLTGPDTATLSAALARSMSKQGYRGVVIDCDPASAAMQTVFGVESGSGLSELLAGQASFEHVIARDKASSAHLMRAGQTREALPELMAEKRMDAIFDALSEVYDTVIVNCGELTEDQTQILKCQGAILMAEASHSGEVAAVAEYLRDGGMQAIQFVRIAKQMQNFAAA
ncbi:hypothetical protein BH10PSE7_BH10PSE7_01240 [soil metagenome]